MLRSEIFNRWVVYSALAVGSMIALPAMLSGQGSQNSLPSPVLINQFPSKSVYGWGDSGVAVDPAGDIFIVDPAQRQVVKLPAGGGAMVTVGSGFSQPFSVAVDTGGNAFVLDIGAGTVVKVPGDGSPQTTVISGLANYYLAPSTVGSVAVDAAGNVFATDYYNNRVVKAPAGGGPLAIVGKGLQGPSAVAVDRAGDVFVGSLTGGVVVEVPANGGAQTIVQSVSGVSALALDSVGNLFVASQYQRSVLEFPATGGSAVLIGPGDWLWPTELAVDAAGHIYVADQNQNNIFEFSSIPRATFVDPVPTLLKGSTIDQTKLTDGTTGRIVNGVAADGTTLVVVEIPAAKANDTFTVNLAENGTNDTDDPGSIALLGSTTFTKGPLQPSALATNGGGVPTAYLVYQAPADFITSSSSPNVTASKRTANLTITGPSGTSTVPILIYRPPIMLVHGLGSGPSTWDNFTSLNQNGAFTGKFQINRVDYSGSALASFSVNAPLVQKQIQAYLASFKNNYQIAATRADLVAHSMGGNLSRLIALGPTYLANSNFKSGFIHKLITIDTPHLGSPFAAKVVSGGGFCSALLGLAPGSLGAFKDLSPNSAALKNINILGSDSARYLTGFTIVGTATSTQEVLTQATSAYLNLKLLCPGLAQPFETILGGANDLIVPATSQTDGSIFFGGASNATAVFPGFVHATVGALLPYGPSVLGNPGVPASGTISTPVGASDPQAVAKKVVSLLNTSATDNTTFGSIIP